MTNSIVILCGGQGTRFQKVSSTIPKVLAQIGDITFLDYIIKKCEKYEVENIILASGHLRNKILEFLKKKYKSKNIVISEEVHPLGTWGAIQNAKKYINSNYFFVMNGDTINNLNFTKALQFIKKSNFSSVMFGSIVDKTNNQETGLFSIDQSGQVVGFFEKVNYLKKKYLYKNSGIYLLNKKIFQMPKLFKHRSLEYDVLPILIKSQKFGIYNENVKFHDFGTLERYNSINSNFEIEEWL